MKSPWSAVGEPKLAWELQGGFPGELRGPGEADALQQSWKSVDSGARMNVQVELHLSYFTAMLPRDAI